MRALALTYGVSFTDISKRCQEKAQEEVSSEEAREIGSRLPLTKQKITTTEKTSINNKREKKKCISESCTGQKKKRQPGLVSLPGNFNFV